MSIIQPRLKNVLVLIATLVFTPFIWMVLFSGSDLSEADLMEKRLAELRDRLHHAESLNQERENDIHSLKGQINILMGAHSHGNSTQQGNMMLPKEARELLANMTFGSSDIVPPSMFHYLPNLIGKPEGLRPAFKLSQGRMGVSIVVGVPTIKRDRESYLMQTLGSLIDSLNDDEREESLIVVFVGEPWDLDYVKQVASQVQEKFGPYMKTGLLEVIAPPALFYPDLSKLRETFGDTLERVKWRTKQNLDFSFLMMYARSRGTYYVQLEDDIVTKPGYFSTMKNFALNQKTDDWILLEFSHLGFIGKLFKSKDIPLVVEFFLMFHKDKPIDWLLDHLLYVKVCNPEKDAVNCRRAREDRIAVYKPDLFEHLRNYYEEHPLPVGGTYWDLSGLMKKERVKHCQRSVAELRRRFKPSLFQHIGTHSSLKGKVQKLKDKDFGKGMMHRAHQNPTAEVSTTLKIYQHYSLDRAYMGETFFWGLIPHPGDMVVFHFVPAIKIEKYLFRSGNPEHPGDKFFNTTVEVLPSEHVGMLQGILDNKAHEHHLPRTADGYLIINRFDHLTGIAQGTVDGSLGLVDTIRLHVQADSQSWVVLSEIFITAAKPGSQR